VPRVELSAGNLRQHRGKQQKVVVINDCDFRVPMRRQQAREFLGDVETAESSSENHDLPSALQRPVSLFQIRTFEKFPAEESASRSRAYHRQLPIFEHAILHLSDEITTNLRSQTVHNVQPK